MKFRNPFVTSRQNGPVRLLHVKDLDDTTASRGDRPISVGAEASHALASVATVLKQSLALGLCLAGCSTSLVSDTGADPTQTSNPTAGHPAGETTATDEQWIAIFLRKAKVGYGVTRFARVDVEGQACFEGSTELNMQLQRFGEVTHQAMRLTSVETLDGQLISFESCLEGAGMQQLSRGVRLDNRLRIEATSADRKERSSISWPPGTAGFFALERSLRQDPPSPGESRRMRAILPIVNQIADIEIEAVGWEDTEFLGSPRTLLRIEVLTRLADGTGIPQTIWLTPDGRTIKTHLPGLEQTTYETTRTDALNTSETVRFDLGTDSMVTIARPLSAPHSSKKMVYHVRLDHGDPSAVFANGGSQLVRATGPRSAELSVIAVRPDHPQHMPPGKPPGAGDLAANQLIESDDPRIVAFSQEVAAGESDPWVIAQSLESHVHQSIDRKDFSQALATATQTVVSRQGDCTEHAVLLAATCRARNIPARVVIGLVYYPAGPGYAYHMWNEVWIGDRWIPLDATLGLGGIGAGHIKLNDSSLAGASAYSCFLPVVRVIGQLALEVRELEM